MTLKEELYQLCLDYANQRLQNIEKTIQSNQKALTSETKSSAGDKHETGRAMLQLEIEKAGQQLGAIQQMKETLAKIDPSKTSEIISLGSLVKTPDLYTCGIDYVGVSNLFTFFKSFDNIQRANN